MLDRARIIAAGVACELAVGLLMLARGAPAAPRFEAAGGWVDGRTGAGYFDLRNPTSAALEVDAVTSPAATTAVLHHGPLVVAGPDGRIAHLFCGDPPADPPEGYVTADFDTQPLAIPAHSDVTISPGHGWLQLSGVRWPRGPVPVRLYLASGGQIDVRLTVR
jgi:hypothetical protein